MSDIAISGDRSSTVDSTQNVQEEVNSEKIFARGRFWVKGPKITFYEAHMGEYPRGRRPVTKKDMSVRQNQVTKIISKTLANHPEKAVHNERVTLIDLRMQNGQGNTIRVKPGQEIHAKVLFVYDTTKMKNPASFNPSSLNQIIVGINNEGAQTCLFHGFAPKGGQVKGEKSFKLHAPEKEGEYDIRFRYAQAMSPMSAVKDWWGVDGVPPESATAGKIIVKA